MKTIKQLKKPFKQTNLLKKSQLKTKNLKPFTVNIKGSLNNMFFSLQDLKGNTKYNTSCGSWNFTGSRKASRFATQDTGTKFTNRLKQLNIKDVHIIVSGIRRFAAKQVVKLLCKSFNILTIQYPNQLPHNGCRKKKKARR